MPEIGFLGKFRIMMGCFNYSGVFWSIFGNLVGIARIFWNLGTFWEIFWILQILRKNMILLYSTVVVKSRGTVT